MHAACPPPIAAHHHCIYAPAMAHLHPQQHRSLQPTWSPGRPRPGPAHPARTSHHLWAVHPLSATAVIGTGTGTETAQRETAATATATGSNVTETEKETAEANERESATPRPWSWPYGRRRAYAGDAARRARDRWRRCWRRPRGPC